MDQFNPQSLISQNRNIESNQVDLDNTFVQLGIYQAPNRKRGASNPNTYKSYTISLQEMFDAFPTPLPPVISDTFLSITLVDASYGNDGLGERNNQDKPYSTINAAIAACQDDDVIVVMPGDYNLTRSIGKSVLNYVPNVKFYMYPGVRVTAIGFPVVDTDLPTTRVVIRGYGTFTNNGFAVPVFQAAAGGSIDIEGESATHIGGFYGLCILYNPSVQGPSRLKFDKMSSLGGTGDGFYIIRGHQLEVECPIIEYSRVGCIIEAGASLDTTLKVKGNFYVKGVGGDFTQFSPSFVLFEGAQGTGTILEIEGNHYDTATVTPLGSSRALASVANTMLTYKGDAQTNTVNGSTFTGAGPTFIKGDLRESTAHGIRINGGAAVTQTGNIVVSNAAADRYPVRFEGTGGKYINYFPVLVSENFGGTAYCVGKDGGTPSTDVYFANLVSNVGLDPGITPFLPTAITLIDPNVTY